MKTILITGITGFLGRNLAKELWYNYRNKYTILGISLSPGKIIKFKSLRRKWLAEEKDIPVFQVNIEDKYELENIFKKYRIDYVVHSAAVKYIELAEKQPVQCVRTNILGTLNILELAKKYNVVNLINISTDKSIKPINTYGMSKYLSEKMVESYGFSTYKGVNFFWSDGSVLDIWYSQILTKNKLSITNFDQIRYFVKVETIVSDLIKNLDNKNIIFFPKKVTKIKLVDLFNYFTEYFKYANKEYFEMGTRDNEKKIEELESEQIILDLSEEEVMEMLDYTFKNTELSFK
jgi:FlaA1/EpsC-like NDP-sugar epimerase